MILIKNKKRIGFVLFAICSLLLPCCCLVSCDSIEKEIGFIERYLQELSEDEHNGYFIANNFYECFNILRNYNYFDFVTLQSLSSRYDFESTYINNLFISEIKRFYLDETKDVFDKLNFDYNTIFNAFNNTNTSLLTDENVKRIKSNETNLLFIQKIQKMQKYFNGLSDKGDNYKKIGNKNPDSSLNTVKFLSYLNEKNALELEKFYVQNDILASKVLFDEYLGCISDNKTTSDNMCQILRNNTITQQIIDLYSLDAYFLNDIERRSVIRKKFAFNKKTFNFYKDVQSKLKRIKSVLLEKNIISDDKKRQEFKGIIEHTILLIFQGIFEQYFADLYEKAINFKRAQNMKSKWPANFNYTLIEDNVMDAEIIININTNKSLDFNLFFNTSSELMSFNFDQEWKQFADKYDKKLERFVKIKKEDMIIESKNIEKELKKIKLVLGSYVSNDISSKLNKAKNLEECFDKFLEYFYVLGEFPTKVRDFFNRHYLFYNLFNFKYLNCINTILYKESENKGDCSTEPKEENIKDIIDKDNKCIDNFLNLIKQGGNVSFSYQKDSTKINELCKLFTV